MGRAGLARVGFGERVPGLVVLGRAANRRRVRPRRLGEALGDEVRGMAPQLLGVLGRLRRGEAHGARRADGPPVRARALGEPGEEGLAELALDGLRLRAHPRRLLRPALRFLAAERGPLLEAPHARQVRAEARRHRPRCCGADYVAVSTKPDVLSGLERFLRNIMYFTEPVCMVVAPSTRRHDHVRRTVHNVEGHREISSSTVR